MAEKLSAKLEKYKNKFTEFEVRMSNDFALLFDSYSYQESIDQFEKEAEENEKTVQQLEHEVEKLHSELAAQKLRRAVGEVKTDDAEKVPPKPKSIKSKASSSGASTSKSHIQVARKSTGGKPPPKNPQPVDEAQESGSEVDEVAKDDAPAAKPKPKPKAKKAVEPALTAKRAGKAKAVEEVADDDDDVQEVAEAPARNRPAPKRKLPEKETKATGGGDGDEDVVLLEKPKRKAAPAKKKDATASKPAPTSDVEEDDKAPPKKKKKINLFPTVQAPGPFAFDSLTHVSFENLNAV